MTGLISLLFVQTLPLTVCAFGIINLGLSAALVVGLTSVADIAEVEVRGRTSAIYLLFAGVLGMAAAPAPIGHLSDTLTDRMSRSSLIACSSIVALVAGLGMLVSIRRLLITKL